uniref:Uncharacterized protein n=1 Tax=Picea glauca TaxID=3330 RepID=A0A101M0K6_PICGL|nr:hypothetical protein ABT39_MTgene4142 [Picea glauca]QHR86020.1 hypothetical protein Q903MT_gene18 [Picea sitchensis]
MLLLLSLMLQPDQRLDHRNQQNQQLNLRDQYSLIGLEETDQTHRSYLDLT